MENKHNQPFKKLILSEQEWRDRLTVESYIITREAGTEPPFSGEYVFETRHGRYLCVCCGHLLFESSGKFYSHCGWASFFEEHKDAKIQRLIDYSHGMIRTELVCPVCDAHLGHVFPDGPPPTGERYCINSFSLEFIEDGAE